MCSAQEVEQQLSPLQEEAIWYGTALSPTFAPSCMISHPRDLKLCNKALLENKSMSVTLHQSSDFCAACVCRAVAALAEDPEFHFAELLEPGTIEWIHNPSIFHSRTEVVDGEVPPKI